MFLDHACIDGTEEVRLNNTLPGQMVVFMTVRNNQDNGKP